MRKRPGARWLAKRLSPTGEVSSVEPQLGNVARIGLDLIALDALDDIGERRIGPARKADLLAFAHDEAVEELDLRAPALLHVLAHRGALLGCRAPAIVEALLVAGAHRLLIALARARDRFRRQVQDLLQLVTVRLPNPDRLAAEPGREPADRLVFQHLAAGQAGAGGKTVAHGVGDQFRPAFT